MSLEKVVFTLSQAGLPFGCALAAESSRAAEVGGFDAAEVRKIEGLELARAIAYVAIVTSIKAGITEWEGVVAGAGLFIIGIAESLYIQARQQDTSR